MIDLLRNAYNLLDEQGRAEVLQFVSSQQNLDGGFKDRGGKSDLYYSLFGGMMLRAWGMGQGAGSKGHGAWGMKMGDGKRETGDGRKEKEMSDDVDSNFSTQDSGFKIQDSNLIAESLLKFRYFIEGQSNSRVPGFIEKCCLVLLQKELQTGRFYRTKTIISLVKSFWKERYSINLSYRNFVLFLTLDAVFPFPEIFKLAAKRMLARTIVDQHSPCSEVAAKVFLLKMLNHDSLKEQELLKLFAVETGGFKAFLHLQQADMLSTSVALFALNYAECDIRLLKPDCLNFIQSNFSDGAFLSGDSDATQDVEYTFYGLLALGVLAD
jgi:hypothetical protein